jgi:hypothetical protein
MTSSPHAILLGFYPADGEPKASQSSAVDVPGFMGRDGIGWQVGVEITADAARRVARLTPVAPSGLAPCFQEIPLDQLDRLARTLLQERARCTRFEVQTNFLCEGWQNSWTLTEGDDAEDGDDDTVGIPERFASAAAALGAVEAHLRNIKSAVTAGNMVDAPDLSEFRVVDIEKGLAYAVLDAGDGKLALGAESALREGEFPRTFDWDVIGTKPDRFDAIEIHGVRFVNEVDVEMDDEKPDFYSTYLHMKEGGVECVGDFPSAKLALQHAQALNHEFGWPIANYVERPAAAPAPRG